MINFRFVDTPDEAPLLAAAEEQISFPLLPAPSVEEAREIAAEYSAKALEAEAQGARPAELLGVLYHVKWARGSSRISSPGHRAPRPTVRSMP